MAEVLAEPDRVGDGKDELLADLLRRPAPGHSYGRTVGAAATDVTVDTRLPLLLLAQVAADIEQSMNEGTWRSVNRRAGRWFAFLATCGYTLAEIEQRVVNDATQPPTPEPRQRPRQRPRHRGEGDRDDNGEGSDDNGEGDSPDDRDAPSDEDGPGDVAPAA